MRYVKLLFTIVLLLFTSSLWADGISEFEKAPDPRIDIVPSPTVTPTVTATVTPAPLGTPTITPTPRPTPPIRPLSAEQKKDLGIEKLELTPGVRYFWGEDSIVSEDAEDVKMLKVAK